MVTKKVEGSAEAVSLDYRGQSSWNPRGADDQTEDAWSPTDHEPSRWGLLIRTNATLYQTRPNSSNGVQRAITNTYTQLLHTIP